MFVSSVKAETEAYKIVTIKNIKGREQVGQCLPFSNEVFNRLNAKGIHAFQVFFYWKSFLHKGNHAIVIYEDKGFYYWVDNEFAKPFRFTNLNDVVPRAIYTRPYYVRECNKPLTRQELK